MSSSNPMMFDKYLLLDKIGVGGMAEVYRAKLVGEQGFEKAVVLKKMLPHLIHEEEMVQHFIDEARLAAQLKHENIVHIYDFGTIAGSFFIAMEYLFGQDLQALLKKSREKNSALELDNILYIIIKVCEGLGYAHNLKSLQGEPLHIIHRDVSPQNIFITYEGQVKLIDFGIAKAAFKSSKTQTGIIKGKVAYMSPEQAGGKAIDHRSDIFAVGIILYELVTQKKMFEGDTFQMLTQVIQAKYEPPENIRRDLPVKLYQIINKSLQIDPDDRYQSCDELGAELEDCLYDLNYRPNPKKLSRYMHTLFAGQYKTESKLMADQMQGEGTSASSAPLQAHPQAHAELTEVIEPMTAHHAQQKVNYTPHPTTPHAYPQTEVLQTSAAPATSPRSGARPKRLVMLAGLALAGIALAGGALAYFGGLDSEREQQIEHLLQAAANSTAAQHIIAPANESALHYYREILKIDPDNDEAAKGLQQIVQDCIKFAEVEISRKNFGAASTYIETGLGIEAHNSDLLKLQSARIAELQKQTSLGYLQESAQKSYLDQRITSPQDNSALYYYQEMLNIDPDNQAGKEGLARIVNHCISSAQNKINQSDLAGARTQIQTGLSIEPHNQRLLELQEKTSRGYLLSAAHKSYLDNRVIAPEGDNALYYYQEVLKIDPNQTEAQAALPKIADKCADFAAYEINAQNMDSARHYVQVGLSIDPYNQRLLALKEQTGRKQRVSEPEVFLNKLNSKVKKLKNLLN